MHDPRARGAEQPQHLGHHPQLGAIADAEQLMGGAGGIAERAEQVEQRAHAELRAHRADVPHRGVMRAREHEADADFVDQRAIASALRRRAHAERFEHVRAARQGRGSAIAVLGHRTPAAATTIALTVDTLKLPEPSPPVPHVSSIGPRPRAEPAARGAHDARGAASSSAVSPLMRNATSNAAIWLGVALRRRSRPSRGPSLPRSSSRRPRLLRDRFHRVFSAGCTVDPAEC